MDDRLYKHVLFKDLLPFVRKDEYLSGYTATEQAYIRKNIGALSTTEISKLLKKEIVDTTYKDLVLLIKNKQLFPGFLYIISDFQTIYKIQETIYSSEVFPIIVLAISTDLILSQAYVQDKSWEIHYDITSEQLDESTYTKGKITYLLDENFNSARFDFKHQYVIPNKFLFNDINDNENSINCHNNNCCDLQNSIFVGTVNSTHIEGKNNQILVDVKNIIGTLNDVIIDLDPINLNNDTFKSIIKFENQYYIDYLDLETLTHQFYATNNSYDASLRSQV